MKISIYKVYTDDPEEIYIGHTTMTLKRRLCFHNSQSNKAVTRYFKGIKQIVELHSYQSQLSDPFEIKKEAEKIEQSFYQLISKL